MTTQNYYARRTARRRQAVDVELMLELVRAERREQPRLGVRKLYFLITAELRQAKVKMGRDRMFEGNCSGRFCGLRQERVAVESAAEVFEDGQAVFAES